MKNKVKLPIFVLSVASRISISLSSVCSPYKMHAEQESAGDDEVVAADAPASSEHHDTRHLSSRRRRRLRRRRLPSNKPATSHASPPHTRITARFVRRGWSTWEGSLDDGSRRRRRRRRAARLPAHWQWRWPLFALSPCLALSILGRRATSCRRWRRHPPHLGCCHRWRTDERRDVASRRSPAIIVELYPWSLFISITMSLRYHLRLETARWVDERSDVLRMLLRMLLRKVSSAAKSISGHPYIVSLQFYSCQRESGEPYPLEMEKSPSETSFFANQYRYNCVLNSIAFLRRSI